MSYRVHVTKAGVVTHDRIYYGRSDAATAAVSAVHDAYAGVPRRSDPNVEYSIGYLHAVRAHWAGDRDVYMGDPYNDVKACIWVVP